MKMKPNPFPMLPAKNFVFPLLRALLTMMKCLKAMRGFDAGDPPPVVLRREGLSNAGYLMDALAELARRAEISLSAYKPLFPLLKAPALWGRHPVDPGAFVRFLKALEAFCIKHKPGLGAAYREDKAFFETLYRQRVLKRKVLVVHGPGDAPDLVVKNLTTGAYYEAEAAPLAAVTERSGKHHVTCFLSSGSDEAMVFFLRQNRIGVDLFLSDLGKRIPAFDMNLCRLIHQAERSGVKFMPPPFATMKLLPAVEQIYVDRLAAFDRAIAAQERAQAREEDALFRGMAEAELYAELIVEAHWRRTAGASLERSLQEAGA